MNNCRDRIIYFMENKKWFNQSVYVRTKVELKVHRGLLISTTQKVKKTYINAISYVGRLNKTS